MDDLLGWYSRWAAEGPSAPALVRHGSTFTYGELWERITEMAAALDGAGLVPGARIVLELRPGEPEWVVALLGVMKAGGQVVVPDPYWGPTELASTTAVLSPDGAVAPGPRVRRLAGAGRSGEYGADGAGIWLFTSGTTAEPKPRFRSSPALARMLDRLHARLPERISLGRPSSVCIVPLYHGFGLLNALLLIHSIGGTVHLAQDDDLSLDSMVPEEDRVPVIYGWPMHFRALARPGTSHRPAATPLEWCVSSSSRLDPGVARAFADVAGCPVRQQYGTTETGPLCLDTDDRPQPRCMGAALDGVEVQIIGEDGAPVPTGAEGRIAVKLQDAELSLEVDGNGFFHPGDLGWQDGDGRVFLSRRYEPFFDERAGFEERH